jgi:hypothetical protein
MELDALVTVVETQSYLNAAKSLLSEAERAEVIDLVSSHPICGDLIAGGGGIRKVRFATGSKGKSGGARIIYLFASPALPLFLLTVFAKNERANLSRAELSALSAIAKSLIADYGK